LVPALVYVGNTSNDAYVLLSTTADGAWGGSEQVLPNSTYLDDAGVYNQCIGAIADPDGNLLVFAIAEDRNHILFWKCNGGQPPTEPKILDLSAPIYGTAAKGLPFEVSVVHGKPTIGWMETDSVARMRWAQFDTYDCSNPIAGSYTVNA